MGYMPIDYEDKKELSAAARAATHGANMTGTYSQLDLLRQIRQVLALIALLLFAFRVPWVTKERWKSLTVKPLSSWNSPRSKV